MTATLYSGVLLGLAAGLTPGPLLALVIGETLRHGRSAGFRVAVAPLITDLPIIAVTLFAVENLSRYRPALAAISFLGGAVVLALGWQTFRSKGLAISPEVAPPRSLSKGVAVNLLSPHPWLFWFGVGSPLLVRAAAASLAEAVGFVSLFYLLLVGSKLCLAFLAGRWRAILSGQAYLMTMRFLGLLLIVFGALLFRDGCLLILGGP